MQVHFGFAQCRLSTPLKNASLSDDKVWVQLFWNRPREPLIKFRFAENPPLGG